MSSTLMVYLGYRFRTELRAGMFWLIGVCIYAGLIVTIYPSVRNAINLSELPPNLRLAFNLANFTELAGFLSAQLLGVILPILLPFFGMISLSFVVAGAEERGRLDLVLANPLPRRSLVLASWIVTAVWLLLISLATGLTIVVVAQARGVGIPFWTAIGATFTLWPISLAFSSLALLLSCLVRQRSTALGVAGALVLISYLDLVIGRLVGTVGWLRYISAFNYYGTAAITGIWWGGVAVLLVASLILLLLAIVAFDRRDIYA